ncbi:MAG: LysR family transcriptional regulator [Pseudomonadota bacterium]
MPELTKDAIDKSAASSKPRGPRGPNPANEVLELDVLRSFVAIVETGNFSRAAEIVHRTPSAVSMQMKKLEDQLGTRLLARDSRSVALTHSGEKLLPYARRMLELNREALSRFMEDNLAGEVRVGAPDNLGDDVLPDVLRRLRESHPGVRVDVSIDFSVNLLRDIQLKKYDLILFTCDPDMSRMPITGETIFTEPLVWAGLQGGTAIARKPLPVAMLEETCAYSRMARNALVEAGIEYTVAYQTQYVGAQKAAIRADMTVSAVGLSQVEADMIILGEDDGMPEIGECSMGMVVSDTANATSQAVADYFRTAFGQLERSGTVSLARVA